jgi:hypothetical protein
VAYRTSNAARVSRASAPQWLASRSAEISTSRGAIRARLAGARRGSHQHRQLLEAPREVGDKPERGPVASVQIVDREQERLLGALVQRKPVPAVQRRETRVRGDLVALDGPSKIAWAADVAPANAGARRSGSVRAGSNCAAPRRKGTLLKLRPARYEHADRVRCGDRRASAKRPDLPIPAGPSSTRDARRAIRHRRGTT